MNKPFYTWVKKILCYILFNSLVKINSSRLVDGDVMVFCSEVLLVSIWIKTLIIMLIQNSKPDKTMTKLFMTFVKEMFFLIAKFLFANTPVNARSNTWPRSEDITNETAILQLLFPLSQKKNLYNLLFVDICFFF